MIDLHCHILPGLDDGARDMAEAVAMARIAVEDGVHTVVGTPHTLNGAFEVPMERILEVTARVREVLERERIGLTLLPGAEVRLCTGLARLVQTGAAGTLNNNGRYLMVEFPHEGTPPGYQEEIFALLRAGITPVLAHPERNLEISRNLGILEALVGMGTLVQVTAMSLTGEFGWAARRCAEEMVRRRLAHVIASDAHWARDRVPALAEAAECAADVLGSDREARRMVEDMPARILAGEPVEVPRPGPPGKRRRWWSR